MKKKHKKKWHEKRPRPRETRIKGAVLREITTLGRAAFLLIPDVASEIDIVDYDTFMSVNQILVRFLARVRPSSSVYFRAMAASGSAWQSPSALVAELSSRREESDEELLELTQEIQREFGRNLEDLYEREITKEIVAEIWKTNPLVLVPSEVFNMSSTQRIEIIDRIHEYVMFLHEKFYSVRPMARAEIAARCAVDGAFKTSELVSDDPELKSMCDAIANEYERS